MAKRRFVVCFDGTWRTPDNGVAPTNVVKLVRAIRSRDADNVSQVVFYDKGVGTSGGTDAVAGGAFGAGLTANVFDGYRFLANNFESGDEIYVFGFSRGAYTARSLAGLIGLAGLLDPADLGRGLHDVMDIYRKRDLDRAEKQRAIEALGLAARKTSRLHCVGVWDTVGSLGIPGDLGRRFLGGKYYFHDVELSPLVDVALHAVAIDEKRSAFSPTLWVSPTGAPAGSEQRVEQVWFAGVHSNVGGSYADTGLSDIAFDWMIRRVRALTDLALVDVAFGAAGPATVPAAKGVDSRTLVYKDSVVYPYQRVINGRIPAGRGFGDWFRRTFPRYDRRNIPPGRLKTVNEAMHVSVLERWNLESVLHDCKPGADGAWRPYRPVNLAAVVDAGRSGPAMPVVGWDGERVADPAEYWRNAAG